MKTHKIILSAMGALGLGLVLGCGGGGGGSSGTPSTVSAESAAIFADNIATIDGCNKVAVGAAPLYAIGLVDNSSKLRDYPINYDTSGVCGGLLNISGQHSNGTNTLVYAYNQFCMNFGAKDMSLSGDTNVVNKGNPGTYGPIVYEDTISTKDRMVGEVQDSTRASSKTFSASLKSFSQKYGSGNKNIVATAVKPDSIKISSADFIDDTSGKKYALSGLAASVYIASNVVKVLSASTTLTGADTGTFTVTGSDLSIPLNSAGLPIGINGTMHTTASDGTKGAVSVNNGVVQILIDDATTVSQQVDCTQFLNLLQ